MSAEVHVVEQVGPIATGGARLDVARIPGTHLVDQCPESVIRRVKIFQGLSLGEDLGTDQLLPETFSHGSGGSRLSGETFGLSMVGDQGQEQADRQALVVTGNERSTSLSQPRQHRLRISDLRMRNHHHGEVGQGKVDRG